MKILVTGHKGFIGGYLTPLLRKKHQVVGYDLVEGDDIRDAVKLDRLFEAGHFDMVIHLAALTGVRRGERFPDEYISTNINGTRNIVEACHRWSVRRLIFFSSSSVLGGCEGGINDKYYPLKEDDRYRPKSLYAVTKVAGEAIVSNFRHGYFIVRPFTVYGEDGRPDMVIYKWINQIRAGRRITVYGDGRTQRGYTYVADLAEATGKLVDRMRTEDRGVLHLGGSEVIELGHLFDIFYYHCVDRGIKFSAKKLPLPDADVHSSFTDSELAGRLLGFRPERRFEEVVKRILKKELKK